MNHKIFSEKDTSKPYYAVLRLIIDRNDEAAAQIIFKDFLCLIPEFEKHKKTMFLLEIENTVTFIKDRINYYKKRDLMVIMHVILRTYEPEKTTFLEIYNILCEIFNSDYHLLHYLCTNPNQTILEVAMILELNYKL